jgi:acyl carrier protein
VKGAGNDKYLAAYVLVNDAVTAGEALVTSLRQAARAALPAYMHPQAYVVLDAFPLTANGKVNKKALPEPDVQAQTEYVAPSTGTETKLAAVWRELLGAQREIGVTENFFEAGGNSLLAMQVLYRVEERLGCRLEITDVFSYQTIQLLGRFIDAMTREEIVSDEDVEVLEY